MKKVSIVTYLRSSEMITPNFLSVTHYFQERALLDKVYVFAVQNNEIDLPENWIIITDDGKTKYERLKYLIDRLPHSLLLSIDNDMTIDCSSLDVFFSQFLISGATIGWGRIGVSNKGFVPDLITVDKILSHVFIRPLLWKCNVGISVPGQCFILRTEDYYSHLPETNTFLDDLQIGLFTCYQKYPVFQSKDILGYENAQDTLRKLFRQRKRWAKGFASTSKTAWNLSGKYYFLILLHGSVYHLFLPILILLILSLYFVNSAVALVITILLLLFLCNGNLFLLGSAFMYCIIFPWLHLFWLFTVISSITRIEDDNQ